MSTNPDQYVQPPAHEWLEELRMDKTLQQSRVERLTEDLGKSRKITQSYLSKIEKGTQELSGVDPYKLEALRFVYGIPHEIWEQKTGVRIPTAARLDVEIITYPNQKYLPLTPPNNAIAHNITTDPDYDWYPVYSFASASLDATHGGEPFIVDYRRLETSRMPRGYTLFRVQGDSMQPTVYDGEDIRVNTNNTKLSDDDIYLLAIPHGQVCVKRVRYLGDEWWMFSDHPDQKTYRPQRIPDGTVVRGHCESKFPVEQPMQ